MRRVENREDAPEEFHQFLKLEFNRRVGLNPRYSLRAFARHLDIDSSSLSQILRGKRPYSSRVIVNLSQKLALDKEIIERFLIKKVQLKSDRKLVTRTYKQLGRDATEVLSSWVHDAICELTKVADFESDVEWIAKRLGLPYGEAKHAIDRLFRLGMLKVDALGNWLLTQNTTNIEGYNNQISKQYQEQILTLAKKAVKDIPLAERNQSSMTMAVDKSKLPKAVEMITQFRRQLCEYLEIGPTTDSVYQMTISLFPLTKKEYSCQGAVQ